MILANQTHVMLFFQADEYI